MLAVEVRADFSWWDQKIMYVENGGSDQWYMGSDYDGTDHGGVFATNATSNGYGLHDMAGNVFEMVQDYYYDGPDVYSRVAVRGGSWLKAVGANTWIEAYKRAIVLDADSAELHFRLARAYFKLEQYLGKVTSRRVSRGGPDRIDGDYFLLGPEPGHDGTFRAAPATSAVFQVHKALELGLDTPEVHRLRGDIWLRLRQYTKALGVFRSINGKIKPPNRPSFEYSFAQAALGVDDVETYLRRLKRAAELDPAVYRPHLVDGFRTAAERCNQRGDLVGYVRYLEAGLKESPNSPDLHYRLGNAFWEAGRRKDAAREWQVTLELNPDHPRRADMLDRIQTASGS
jgi:tetratricopeptide (TPR) repeat protein